MHFLLTMSVWVSLLVRAAFHKEFIHTVTISSSAFSLPQFSLVGLILFHFPSVLIFSLFISINPSLFSSFSFCPCETLSVQWINTDSSWLILQRLEWKCVKQLHTKLKSQHINVCVKDFADSNRHEYKQCYNAINDLFWVFFFFFYLKIHFTCSIYFWWLYSVVVYRFLAHSCDTKACGVASVICQNLNMWRGLLWWRLVKKGAAFLFCFGAYQKK